MKLLKFVLVTLFFLLVLLSPLTLLAQGKKGAAGDTASQSPPPYGSICELSVYYQLLPKPDSQIAGNKAPASSPTKILYTTLSEQGVDSEQLKQRLAARVAKAQAEAMQTCKARAGDEANCLSVKLSVLAPEFPALDYQQRKLLLASARQDCQAKSLDCGPLEVSKIKCWLNVPPEVTVPNEPKYEYSDLSQPE